jgi:hypothetical protein
MDNTDNSNVSVAKLYYNTTNDFSTAILKDSVVNPFGTINFMLNGITNLGANSVYFFLAFDVADTACNQNILDAHIPAGGIVISGNNGGQKSATNDPHPSGNKTIIAAPIVTSVSITEDLNNVSPGSSVTLTPHPVNGGSNPTYAWYMNGLYTVSTTGAYVLSNLQANTSVYCAMTSNLVCATPQTINSAVKSIVVKGYEYGSSSFFQVTGTVTPGATNQPILYGMLEGVASQLSGGWGVNSLSFTMANSNNSNVTKAKLWYNTINDFSSAMLKDSVANPTGTIVFTVSGVSDLKLSPVYFFITYDIATNGVCGGNVLDALVPSNGISITGNNSGVKSVTNNPNPSGNLTINSAILTPSVSIVSSKSKVTSGNAATFTPLPVNGGVAPSYDWYVNSIFVATTSGSFTLNNITDTVDVYCIMNSDLACISTPTVSSSVVTVTITSAKYAQSRFYQVSGTLIPGAKNQQNFVGSI